jgi:hypothetical protein
MGRFGVSLGRRFRKVGKMCPRFQMFWLRSSQPQPNINATHFVIYHNKNALKSPGNISEIFLIFFTLTLLQRPSFLSNNFLNSLHRFFSQNLLIKLIRWNKSVPKYYLREKNQNLDCISDAVFGEFQLWIS